MTSGVTTATDTSSEHSNPTGSQYENMSMDNLAMLLTLRGFDIQGMEKDKDRLIREAIKGDGTCYDEAAKEVMAYVNSSSASRKHHKALDSIWKNAKTGAKVYVGNATAAANKRLLKRKKIFAIVNCQNTTSLNYHEGKKQFYYHRFPVTTLAMNKEKQFDCATGAGAYNGGFHQTFEFMEEQLRQGRNVLIHCAAGAHRAGTVGVAWLMKQHGLGAVEAIAKAKTSRPIVQPFGLLLGLLHFLEMDLARSDDAPQVCNEVEQVLHEVPCMSS